MTKGLTPAGGKALRNDVLALISRKGASMEKALEAISQCRAQISNRMLVEQTAKACGLRLSSFLTNESLELYYDIKQKRYDLGFISKGWDDPGFRIGELMHIPKSHTARLKDNIFTLLRFCSTRGVAVSIDETRDGMDLQFDSVIYLEGFNREVFEQVRST